MATDYGFDVACVSDTGPVDVIVTSPVRVIGERVARRLLTPRGGLATVDESGDDFGWDVRQYLNGKVSPAGIALAQAQVKAEAEKDEEVQSANVTITFANGNLTITVRMLSALGPFILTMNVSQASYTVFVGAQ